MRLTNPQVNGESIGTGVAVHQESNRRLRRAPNRPSSLLYKLQPMP